MSAPTLKSGPLYHVMPGEGPITIRVCGPDGCSFDVVIEQEPDRMEVEVFADRTDGEPPVNYIRVGWEHASS